MAPEVINRKPYDTRVDIWSACVVLYVLLSGEQPFYAQSQKQTQKAICEQDIHFSKSKWHGVSVEARDFISIGLSKDPRNRSNCEEL